MTPSAAWLRDTRQRHRTPEGRPWSQEYVVDRINEWAAATAQRGEKGEPWRLHRPNYVGYEGATVPTQPILDKLVAFWVAQGEDTPDLTPPSAPEPAPDLATALLALARELAAAREERASLRAELDDLHELVGRLAQERLSGPVPEGSRGSAARPQTTESGR